MKRKRPKRFKRFKIKLNPTIKWVGCFFILSLIIFGSLGYAIYTLQVFKVKAEDIISNVDIGQKLKAQIEGTSLFSLDIQSISSYLLKKNPDYKEVEITKKFPSTVVIKVKKRVAYAQIKAKRFYPIDQEAVIISNGAAVAFKQLIPIELNTDSQFFRKGYTLRNEGLKIAFDLIAALKKEKFFNIFRVLLINATHPQALYFMLDLRGFYPNQNTSLKPIKVIIGAKDFSQKLTLLKEVIDTRLKDKLQLVRYIDLRYEKVYVGFRR